MPQPDQPSLSARFSVLRRNRKCADAHEGLPALRRKGDVVTAGGQQPSVGDKVRGRGSSLRLVTRFAAAAAAFDW